MSDNHMIGLHHFSSEPARAKAEVKYEIRVLEARLKQCFLISELNFEKAVNLCGLLTKSYERYLHIISPNTHEPTPNDFILSPMDLQTRYAQIQILQQKLMGSLSLKISFSQ